MPVTPKNARTILVKSFWKEHVSESFEADILAKTQLTIPYDIFCE